MGHFWEWQVVWLTWWDVWMALMRDEAGKNSLGQISGVQWGGCLH